MNGDLECGSDACIEGTFEGRIEATGKVEIAASGSAKAEIDADSVIVHGRLEGSLNARARASLGAGCRVEGSVAATRLKVEEGAELSLQVRTGEEAAKAPPARAAAEPAGARNRIKT
jgi:cytoskeletal protein CcmA (bactofilin family)